MVVEDFDFKAPKTKEYLNFLKNLGVVNEKTMLVLSENKKSILLSARNLSKTNVVSSDEINVYNILDASKLIIVESALKNKIKNSWI